MKRITKRKLCLNIILFICCISTLLIALVWYYPTLFLKSVSQPSNYEPIPISGLVMECRDESMPMIYSYCVISPKVHKSERVVYHFHGRKGNARWWNDDTYYSGDVYRHWKTLGVEVPTVISVSFGPLWLFNESKLSMLDTVIENIESTLGFNVQQRQVVGESMGGVNALTLWGQNAKKFSSVAALCPPLPTVSPYGRLGDQFKYLTSSNTSWRHGLMMIIMGRAMYTSDKQWNYIDVLQRIKNTSSPKKPLYLSCGKQDDWGCMEGSKQIVSFSRVSNTPIKWVPRKGGHCDIDAQSLAQFLATPYSG